jgi:glycosyltransferase involved in cell wall biosynthesis
MKTGWLVNDKLTCIIDTKTFWHDLLEWNPNLINKCNEGDFYNLANHIEYLYNTETQKPDYIIRNATFFRQINIPSNTISILQDSYLNVHHFGEQINVCNNSKVTVFNSPFVYNQYKDFVKNDIRIIPLGTDFNFFRNLNDKQNLKYKYNLNQNKNYIIFIGDSSDYPKGFDILKEVIDKSNFDFVLVMKDDFKIEHERVKLFNKINHDTLLELINCCDVSICTSKIETLHLAGIECAACNLPIVASNVGVYNNDFDNTWGHICNSVDEYIVNINRIIDRYDYYNSRESFLYKKLDKESCKKSWVELVGEM